MKRIVTFVMILFLSSCSLLEEIGIGNESEDLRIPEYIEIEQGEEIDRSKYEKDKLEFFGKYWTNTYFENIDETNLEVGEYLIKLYGTHPLGDVRYVEIPLYITPSFEKTPDKAFEFDKKAGFITGYDISYGTTVVIPNTINGTHVNAIGDFAFTDLGLKAVVISEGISEIGFEAFSGNDITYLDLPEGLYMVQDNAFTGSPLTTLIFAPEYLPSPTLFKDAEIETLKIRPFNDWVDPLMVLQFGVPGKLLPGVELIDGVYYYNHKYINDDYFVVDYDESNGSDITILGYVNGYRVTEILPYAFEDGVFGTIHFSEDSTADVNEYAFLNCTIENLILEGSNYHQYSFQGTTITSLEIYYSGIQPDAFKDSVIENINVYDNFEFWTEYWQDVGLPKEPTLITEE